MIYRTDSISIAIVVGVGLTVTGFALAADGGFNQPMSYSFIIAGVVLIGLAITNFIFTKRIPVIPPVSISEKRTIFRHRN